MNVPPWETKSSVLGVYKQGSSTMIAMTPLRELLKRSTLLVNVVRSLKQDYEIVRGSVRTNYKIVDILPAFSPDSGPTGAFRAKADLTLQSVQQTFPLICCLAD